MGSISPGPPSRSRPVRVLIVDDSATMRRLVSGLLEADPLIEVVGTAADPYIARDKIKKLAPDVLTLDVEMPRMDGVSFLRNLMRLRPMPVVMVSSLTEQGAGVTLDALAAGAVDFVAKPRVDVEGGLEAYGVELRTKIHNAASTPVARLAETVAHPPRGNLSELLDPRRNARRVLAIGASTGGTEAIRQVLSVLPAGCPPVVIAQHIPAAFSTAFAERLDRYSALSVQEAGTDQPLLPGQAWVAPGGRQLRVYRNGSGWRCRTTTESSENGHKPSVDIMFESMAEHVGRDGSAALLTGMGSDGARGMLRVRDAGGFTVAQDQPSSVVWGMPRAAVSLGAAREVVPLDHIAERLIGGGENGR